MDFFHKGASMTKRVTGIAKLKGIPHVHPRPARKISKIGTFFDGDRKIASVLLEVADTNEARRLGLMGRERLPSVCGMLFEGLSGGGTFWMKNCLIPLDIAFMDSDGVVTRVYSMPLDEEGEKHYEYNEDDVSAVEVNMGMLGKWGVSPGARMTTRPLSDSKENDDG